MGYNITENIWDKGEVDAVAGGKKENNSAAKKSQLYKTHWGLPHTLLFGPRIRKNTFTPIRTNQNTINVAVLIPSTEYICPWFSCVSRPWKIPVVVVFLSKARALLSSLLLLTLHELPAQMVATHVIKNKSPAHVWLLHTWLLCKTYLKMYQKTKGRKLCKSIDRLILGNSSLPWLTAMLEIHHSLTVALNLDLNSNWAKI